MGMWTKSLLIGGIAFAVLFKPQYWLVAAFFPMAMPSQPDLPSKPRSIANRYPSEILTSETFMKLTGKTSMPIGHYQYCKEYKEDCRRHADIIEPTQLNHKRWRELVAVNQVTNLTITSSSDQKMHGKSEVWSYPTTHGDSEDFALMKRDMLIKQGWPAANLLMTVVRSKSCIPYAVLTVRTNLGEFVMAENDDQIRHWTDVPYHFIKRQTSVHAGHWNDIDDKRRKVQYKC